MTDVAVDAYRYRLTRRWGFGAPACFVMLNPSTADDRFDDPTIRRCTGFARGWDVGGLEVVNLFAQRATDPKDLDPDPFVAAGPGNYAAQREAIGRCAFLVLAWGASVPRGRGWRQPIFDVLALADDFDKESYCLGKTASGQPRHPLYVRGDTELRPWP